MGFWGFLGVSLPRLCRGKGCVSPACRGSCLSRGAASPLPGVDSVVQLLASLKRVATLHENFTSDPLHRCDATASLRQLAHTARSRLRSALRHTRYATIRDEDASHSDVERSSEDVWFPHALCVLDAPTCFFSGDANVFTPLYAGVL